jgi:hypothetical protein
MAVSLALNWSPPPSSPLFEDSTTLSSVSSGKEGQGNSLASSLHAQTTNTPPSTSNGRGSGPSVASPTLASESGIFHRQQLQVSPAIQNGGHGPQSSPMVPNLQSYAAVASNRQQQQQQQESIYQMPTYPNPALTTKVSEG